MHSLNPRIAVDLFEGEYVIANLETGLYYSLQGTATYFLRNLPVDIDQTAAALIKKFPEQTQVLLRIAEQLKTEDIVRKTDTSPLAHDLQLPDQEEPSSFNKYADMQDLLLLDPIHEVDEQGWEVRQKVTHT